MQQHPRARFAAIASAACLAVASTLALAEDAPPGGVTGSAAITGYGQFNTDLDSGGRFNWAGGIATANLARDVTSQLSVGLQLRYEYQSWNFNSPTAFGGDRAVEEPERAQHRRRVQLCVLAGMVLQRDADRAVGVRNRRQHERLAWSYGAVASASKVFSPDLVVGLGVSVFRRIDKTQALPFLVVNWKINDKWRINNPFAAGPIGGAGLEAVYSPDDNGNSPKVFRTAAIASASRTDAPTANGIGENSFIPLFLRISHKFSKDLRLDFYGAIITGGKLSVDNSNGSGRYSDNYKTSPALGGTLLYKF